MICTALLNSDIGKAYGNRVQQHLGSALEKFLARDTLMIGICNGFQIMTSAGILPGALIANDYARYSCRWVDLEVHSASPWLKGIKSLSIPIAHGEGKFYAPPELLEQLNDVRPTRSNMEARVVLRYVAGETSKHFDMPAQK